MISHDQLAKALARQGLTLDDRKVNALMLDLLPNPQSGFSCDGATVWGDSQSIDKVKNWNHSASHILAWRNQLDAMQQRAMRAEELGLVLLEFVLRVSAANPASNAVSGNAHTLLESLNIEPREGFFHTRDAALADARTKFYDAAHRS